MSISRRAFLFVAAAGASGCGRTRSATADLRRWLGKPAEPPLEADLTPPSSAGIDPVSHVLNRITFGARPGDYARVSALGVQAFIEEQLAPEKIDDWQCDRVVRHEFEELSDPESRIFPRPGGGSDPISQMFPELKSNGSSRVGDLYEFKDKPLLESLTRAAILRATLSRRQLQEVMVQFWSDHFNIDPSKAECRWLKAADDRDVIRKHALGNFREMLRASALSPAMLWYLDGRVNQKKSQTDRPNENYARELLELHTLGVHGGYTQQDVMEVARCLTGWQVRDRKKLMKGKVSFEPGLHDDGAKLVLGSAIAAGGGMGDLDRVLDIVARHPSTARYLATKLCRRFIADEPPSSAVEPVAQVFAASGGDIPETLRAVFATPEFWQSVGAKLKRPFHFAISALRGTNAETDGARPVISALLRMGHAPFRYPTPDGYPEEAFHWTGTLLWRWNFANDLASNKMKGTRVRVSELTAKLGGDAGLHATLLGRRPSEEESAAWSESRSGLALALASPAFQRC